MVFYQWAIAGRRRSDTCATFAVKLLRNTSSSHSQIKSFIHRSHIRRTLAQFGTSFSIHRANRSVTRRNFVPRRKWLREFSQRPPRNGSSRFSPSRGFGGKMSTPGILCDDSVSCGRAVTSRRGNVPVLYTYTTQIIITPRGEILHMVRLS